MSTSEFKTTKNPLTGAWEKAEWIPNYFAGGVTGVRFLDKTVYNADLFSLMVRRRTL